VILYEGSNEIRFNYDLGHSAGDLLNVAGIENSDGSIGLRYAGLSTSNVRGRSVLFYLGEPGTTNPEPEPDPDPQPDLDADGDGYTVAQGDCDGLIDENCPVAAASRFYFPLLAAAPQTYLGLVNNHDSLVLSGVLEAYNGAGNLLPAGRKMIELKPLARQEFALAEIFPESEEEPAYVVFAGDAGATAQGYCRFIDQDAMRGTSYPALFPQKGLRELYVPYLLYGSGWSTVIGFVSHSDLQLSAEIQFNNGAKSRFLMRPHGQLKLTLVEDSPVTYNGAEVTLGELSPATAATIKFTHIFAGAEDLVVGAVLYQNESQMGATELGSASYQQLQVSSFVMDDYWWSSLAFYNPSSAARTAGECPLQFNSYSGAGKRLDAPVTDSLPSALGALEGLVLLANQLPAGTNRLELDSGCAVAGIEFLGTGDAMDCVTVSDLAAKSGVFARLQYREKGAWSGLSLLNRATEGARVTLIAYDDEGNYLGEEEHRIEPRAQLSGLPEDLFSRLLSAPSCVRYVADHALSGLVINYQSTAATDAGPKSALIDILPALVLETSGSLY